MLFLFHSNDFFFFQTQKSKLQQVFAESLKEPHTAPLNTFINSYSNKQNYEGKKMFSTVKSIFCFMQNGPEGENTKLHTHQNESPAQNEECCGFYEVSLDSEII